MGQEAIQAANRFCTIVRDTNLTFDRELDAPWLRPYTKHMLRRYAYLAYTGRYGAAAPIDPVGRGWASSHAVRTFDDRLHFVIDMDRCFAKLPSLDRAMLKRNMIQGFTQEESAQLLGMSTRAFSYKFASALDRMTEQLIQYGLMVVEPQPEYI